MKLLETFPDKHMAGLERLRTLKNGVPQGSVLAPMLLNNYIHDLPATQSRKYDYTDDLAILLSKSSWEPLEEDLSEDMNILSSYLKNWRLKLSDRQCSIFTTKRHIAK